MTKMFKNKAHAIFNIVLLVIIIGYATYAWMLTFPSRGEIVDYSRNLIITSSSLDVDVYVYRDGQYVLTNDDPITCDMMAPGMMQKYRFDLTNNNSVKSSTNIIFSNITGDIELLKEKLYIGETNPDLFENQLTEKLEYKESTDTYSYKFANELGVEPGETVSLYWYIYIDKYASNEISDTNFAINKIMFVKP